MSAVPIIVVFTKFDLFVEKLNEGKDKINLEFAEERFKDEHSREFEKWTSSQIPYNVTTSTSVSSDVSLVLTSPCSFTPGYFAASG